MINRNIPRLRFNGFDSEWKESTLGDVGKVKMNKRILKKETSEDGDIPFFKIGTFGKKPNAFISRKRFVELKNKYAYPKKGDILLSASGTLGRTVIYHGEDAYFQDSNIIWLDIDNSMIINDFLYQFYRQHKWTTSEGSTIKRLYNRIINNTSINLPSIPEQNKIGTFFTNFDYLIELHSKKFEQLKKLERGYLQKMFPQNGKTKPRIRFNSFLDDWKKVNLDDISTCEVSNYTEGQFNKVSCQGKYKVFEVSGEVGSVDSYDQQNEYISIVKDGSGVGTVTLRPAKTSVINTMNYIKGNNCNTRFLFYLLKTFSFRKYINGTGIPHIYYKDYSKEKVLVPSIEEQEKIGDFFYNFDKHIRLENEIIKMLKKQRKAYLQKMIV